MAPRKSQKDSAQGPGRGAPHKRARRGSSLVESDASHNQPIRTDSSQSQGIDAASESISLQPIMSWAALVNHFETEPMTTQIQRHKDWRRTYMKSLHQINANRLPTKMQEADLHMTVSAVSASNRAISILAIHASQRFMPDAFQMALDAMLKTSSFALFVFDVVGTWPLLHSRLLPLQGQHPHES